MIDNVSASKDAVIEKKKERERARVVAAEKRQEAKKPSRKAQDRAKALVSAREPSGRSREEQLAV